jgi:hypothetical protein
MRGRTLPLLALLALILPPACGGAADPNGLLAGGHGGSSSGSGSGGAADAGTGSSSSSGGHVDAGAPEDAEPQDSGGGGPIDVGVPEASPVPDSGGGDAFLCPPSTCKTPEVCCATGTGPGLTPTYKCQAASHTCSNTAGPGTPIACATNADCTSGVCCGDNENGFYSQVSCQPTCTGPTPNGGTYVQFCNPAASDCPPGALCQASQVLLGFHVCN